MTSHPRDSDAVPAPTVGWRAPLLGGAAASLLWSVLLVVPFYHDDWGALYHARQAIAAGESILSPFAISDDPGIFWRPISVALHWRLIAGALQGSAIAAHALNLLLLIAGSAAVGNFAANVARVLRGAGACSSAFLPAFLYGIHGAMFLPIAWSSGAQELYAILFSALFLRGIGAWGMGFPSRSAAAERLWILFTPAFLALALMSKEGAAVLPLLAAIMLWMVRQKPRSALLPACCAIVWIAWFALRWQRVAPVPDGSPYSYEFGTNIVRNAGALAAFSLNLPREALQVARLAGERSWLWWGAACALLQSIAVVIIAWRARPGRHVAVALLGFWCAAVLPVLPLAWNCYPYYALIGLMAFAIVVAMTGSDHLKTIAALSSQLSAVILISGQFFLPYPAPIAAARWGDRQLKILQQSEFRAQQGRYAVALDERSFGAMGNEHGIAMALGIRAEQVVPPHDPPEDCRFIIRMPQATMRADVVIERTN